MHICRGEKTVRNSERKTKNKQGSKVNYQYTLQNSFNNRCPIFMLSLTRRCISSPRARSQISTLETFCTRAHPGQALVFEDHHSTIFIMPYPVTSQSDRPGLARYKSTAGIQRSHQALQKVQSCQGTIYGIRA